MNTKTKKLVAFLRSKLDENFISHTATFSKDSKNCIVAVDKNIRQSMAFLMEVEKFKASGKFKNNTVSVRGAFESDHFIFKTIN